MKIPDFIKVYGDTSFRGQCPLEDTELIDFFTEVYYLYPKTYHLIAFHPKNEGKKKMAQVQKDKAKGQKKGVSDIIVPGNPTLIIELKRKDHTQSYWEDGQIQFLEQAHKAGAYVCLALGLEAAIQAFNDWVKIVEKNS